MRKGFSSDIIIRVRSAQGHAPGCGRGFSSALLAATLLSGFAGGEAFAAEGQASGTAAKHTAHSVPHKAAGQAVRPAAVRPVSGTAASGATAAPAMLTPQQVRTLRGTVAAPGPLWPRAKSP